MAVGLDGLVPRPSHVFQRCTQKIATLKNMGWPGYEARFRFTRYLCACGKPLGGDNAVVGSSVCIVVCRPL